MYVVVAVGEMRGVIGGERWQHARVKLNMQLNTWSQTTLGYWIFIKK
jgi:hypothetical protein